MDFLPKKFHDPILRWVLSLSNPNLINLLFFLLSSSGLLRTSWVSLICERFLISWIERSIFWPCWVWGFQETYICLCLCLWRKFEFREVLSGLVEWSGFKKRIVVFVFVFEESLNSEKYFLAWLSGGHLSYSQDVSNLLYGTTTTLYAFSGTYLNISKYTKT